MLFTAQVGWFRIAVSEVLDDNDDKEEEANQNGAFGCLVGSWFRSAGPTAHKVPMQL